MTSQTSDQTLSGPFRAVWRWHFYAGLLVLPFLWQLARSRELMGDQAIRGGESLLSGAALVLIAASILTLGVLTVL